MAEACTKCGTRHLADRVEAIVAELAQLADGTDNVHRVKARLRQLSLMLGGLCASCAHHAARREFHKCKKCNRPVAAPATRCDRCGGELWGIAYPKGRAA